MEPDTLGKSVRALTCLCANLTEAIFLFGGKTFFKSAVDLLVQDEAVTFCLDHDTLAFKLNHIIELAVEEREVIEPKTALI